MVSRGQFQTRIISNRLSFLYNYFFHDFVNICNINMSHAGTLTTCLFQLRGMLYVKFPLRWNSWDHHPVVHRRCSIMCRHWWLVGLLAEDHEQNLDAKINLQKEHIFLITIYYKCLLYKLLFGIKTVDNLRLKCFIVR